MKKRTAQGEVKTNNLFATRKEGFPVLAGPPIKSRFFGAASILGNIPKPHAKVKVNIEKRIADFDVTPGPAEHVKDREPRLDMEEMLEDAEACRIAEDFTQDAEDASHCIKIAQRPEEDHFGEGMQAHLPPRTCDTTGKKTLARHSTPHRKSGPVLHRTSTPRQPLSETGFIHISSPNSNTATHTPTSKRVKVEHDSGFDENGCFLESVPELSSPGFMLASPSQGQNITLQADTSDLFGTPSRSSKPSKHEKREKLRPIRYPRSRSRYTNRPKHADTIECQRENAAPKFHVKGMQPQELKRTKEHSSEPEEIHSIQSSSPPRPPDTHQITRLPRQNAKIPKIVKHNIKGKARKPMDDENEGNNADLDQSIKSVMASWREKFSHNPVDFWVVLSDFTLS